MGDAGGFVGVAMANATYDPNQIEVTMGGRNISPPKRVYCDGKVLAHVEHVLFGMPMRPDVVEISTCFKHRSTGQEMGGQQKSMFGVYVQDGSIRAGAKFYMCEAHLRMGEFWVTRYMVRFPGFPPSLSRAFIPTVEPEHTIDPADKTWFDRGTRILELDEVIQWAWSQLSTPAR